MTITETDTFIEPEKINAYRETAYCVRLQASVITLTIGARHDALAELFASHSVNCGGFITAYNPRGREQPSDANKLAHHLLTERLHVLRITSLEAFTETHTNTWPTEYGLFVLGLPLEQAKSLGREFDQDALVWVGHDLIPSLILLR
jgi:hypothetical protein